VALPLQQRAERKLELGMRSTKRSDRTIGIPQITKTPAKLPDPFQVMKWIRGLTGKSAPEEKRRRIDNANIQIVKLARQAVKTFRRAS